MLTTIILLMEVINLDTCLYGVICFRHVAVCVEDEPPGHCFNGGTCTSPGVCACPEGYEGNTCESRIQKNQGYKSRIFSHFYVFSSMK